MAGGDGGVTRIIEEHTCKCGHLASTHLDTREVKTFPCSIQGCGCAAFIRKGRQAYLHSYYLRVTKPKREKARRERLAKQ